MTYSDYDKVFEVCTNAWYTQLGMVITQYFEEVNGICNQQLSKTPIQQCDQN